MWNQLLKLANELEKEKKYDKVDSITKYLIELSKSKILKSSPELKNDVPTKLLMLEKAGVDTSEFFQKLKQSDLDENDLESINQKFEINCPDEEPNQKNTDLHEYVLWMNKEKNIPVEKNKEDSEKYLNTLRDSFIDFLTEEVLNDWKIDNENKLIDSNSLIQFYFDNREKYENKLDEYDLMLGQTEGIMSDEEFEEELADELTSNEPGPIVRRGE